MDITEFQELIWQKSRELFRDMPWRENTDPYYVLVSELMLQQTQVDRVIPKFDEFVHFFPTIKDLAQADLADVLRLWNGLGYNRRAKFLHDSAKKVIVDFDGHLPNTRTALMSLPGVGPNTAGAILVYSFNQPALFVETNIRTVYFHHFFANVPQVSDQQLTHVLEQTIDREHPREWYWALMDYGSLLKKQGAGRLDQSRHYKKQSPLRGSIREVRGQIIHALTQHDMTKSQLIQRSCDDDRFELALGSLVKDGLVSNRDDIFHLTK